MDIKHIINKKANKKALTRKEICFFVDGYTNGTITDYQASALLMAIKINGMSENETFWLTDAMLQSGDILNLSDIGTVCDKHSTGGVSDTTTLALAPICAACGVKMLKLSGRGLGFTGGTIDKVESFNGYNVDISMEKAKDLVIKNGACVIAANLNLAPADKKLYALRDTTSTVESIPLIASSIMSKKLASGANVIVLDVKYGNGAFMKTKSDAKKLAELMVKIGELAGKKMDYVLDDMNEPLGYNVGNKLEAYEAIELLRGKKGKLRDSTLTLASKCISLSLNTSKEQAYKMAEESIADGSALEKFKQMIKAQGGSIDLFTKGLNIQPSLIIKSNSNGILKSINCAEIGRLVGLMGATRQKITDTIDYNVGVRTFHKLNNKIKKGEVLFEIYANNENQANKFAQQFINCYKIEQN